MKQLLNFSLKAARKLEWDALRRRGASPEIETLHRRRIPADQLPTHWVGDEFVRCVKGPVFIDPLFGWLVTPDGYLIKDSLPAQIRYKASWRIGLPSWNDLQKGIRAAQNVVHYPEIISLRYPWEYNYYHFHLDVLGKLNLFRSIGIGKDVPVTVGRYARQLKWAKEILDQIALQDYKFSIPDLDNRQIICADQVYYCQTQQGYQQRMEYILELMRVPIPQQSPGPQKSGRRVFLTRYPPATRTLTNAKDIENVVKKHGYEVIDTAGMSVRDQIGIFNTTRHLIALHGAGMANIVYRRGAPLSVLELHGSGSVSEDMLNIARDYGYQHYRIVGKCATNPPILSDYYIDPTKLNAVIERILREDPVQRPEYSNSAAI